MKECRIVASVFNDLLTLEIDRYPLANKLGYASDVHAIKCSALEEIPDLFLDVCGNECDKMKDRIYWYVDEGNGLVLTDM